VTAVEDIDAAATVGEIAGIADADWLEWFGAIEGCYDPWCDWLKQSRFPHCGPLQADIERDIEAVIRVADQLRLSVVPKTERFAAQWQTFRKHHEELDSGGKYRRRRYMVWRAAALKVLCYRDCFQDEIDARQAHDKLAATMHYFWPTIAAGGSYPGGNFWQPALVDFADGRRGLDLLGEYAAMVLLVTAQVLRAGGP
jgi:hypothetical protein